MLRAIALPRFTKLAGGYTAAAYSSTLLPRRSFSTEMAAKRGVDKLVSAQWLRDNIEKTKVLDCSWYLPFLNRDTKEEFRKAHIPGAQFFDIDEIKDMTKAHLPHMLPPPEVFSEHMDRFGITNNDHVVVYDSQGVGSACRVFWTLNVLGHNSVSVLDGGLPAWLDKQYPTESGEANSAPTNGYKATLVDSLIRDYDGVVGIIGELKSNNGSKGTQIVDARPTDRFAGKVPEFRPGLSSGHMPGAISVPSSIMTNSADSSGSNVQKLKSPQEIRKIFEDAGVDLSRPIVASCGSGITASVLYFALLNAGASKENLSVYDGSWTEYGLNPNSEIVKDSE